MTRENGSPICPMRGSWVNVYDGLDPVAGFDAVLADDYQRDGVAAIDDIHEPKLRRLAAQHRQVPRRARLRGELQRLLGSRRRRSSWLGDPLQSERDLREAVDALDRPRVADLGGR